MRARSHKSLALAGIVTETRMPKSGMGVWYLILFLSAGFSPAIADTQLSPHHQQEMVAAHNRWRAQVGVDGLDWAADLADQAQGWAERLRSERGCTMRHSGVRELGENLFWASPRLWSNGRRELQEITPTQVIDAWGSEKRHYSHTHNSCRSGERCGHYTQLVWRRTREVGCGVAQCTDKSQVWVCHYRPAGNWVGERPY